MPNMCSNELLITGNEHELVLFSESVKRTRVGADGTPETSPLSFEQVVPVPEELYSVVAGWTSDSDAQRAIELMRAEMEERYGHADWYDYRVARWGTKWDALDVEVHRDGASLTYTFETAWSPPLAAIHAASAKFRDLTFALDYSEPGVGYRGRTVFRAGWLIEDWCEDWDPFEEGDESSAED